MRVDRWRWLVVRGALLAPALTWMAACERATAPSAGPSAAESASLARIPGTAPAGPSRLLAPTIAQTTTSGLNPVYSATGNLTLSLDACGTNAANCTIQVQKPAGAIVRAVFAASATTPNGPVVPPGNIRLNGAAIPAWTATQDNVASFGTFRNYWADVTALLKPTIDAAPAGTVNVTSAETGTGQIDGVILAVVFDDPNVTNQRSVVLLFGGQRLTGDQFVVTLTNPIDKSDPNLLLNMSLGISFGFQGSTQFSIVDINGQRLTSSAGGQDDGLGADGALITVGGLGDENDNPNPTAAPSNPRTDDELYDLRPFVNTGETLIRVDTRNPSNDDNIFFAAFYTTVPSRVDVPVPVQVDVRPADPQNRIVFGPSGTSLVPIVLFGTPTFDVTTVDPASATLGNETGVETPIARNRGRNGATTPAFRLQDIDGDGRQDMQMWFDKAAMIANGDLTLATTQLIFQANINPTGKARGVMPVVIVP